jgi:hypothetical protein
MSDLEGNLKAARLAAPSPDLDRRINEAFAAAAEGRKPRMRARRGWWIAILAPLGAAAAMFLLSTRPQREPLHPIIHQMMAQGAMRQFLTEPPQSGARLPHFVTRAQTP